MSVARAECGGHVLAEVGLDHLRVARGSRPACPRRSSRRSRARRCARQMPITTFMSCSISRIVRSKRSRGRPRSGASAPRSPAGSARPRARRAAAACGSAASARAISRRRCCAVRQLGRARVGPRREPERVEQLVAPARAIARSSALEARGAQQRVGQARARVLVRGDAHVVAAGSGCRRAGCSGTCARCRGARSRCGRRPLDRPALEAGSRPAVGA